jgi:DNA-binding protein H-NS
MTAVNGGGHWQVIANALALPALSVNNVGFPCVSFTSKNIMPKSLAQIEAQIAKLQKAAEAIKSKEVAAVVARIHALMKEHGLTVEQLGAAPKQAAKAPRKTRKAAAPAKTAKAAAPSKGAKAAAPAKASRKTAKPVKAAKAVKPAKTAKATKATKAAKTVGVIKYRDDAGNAWTGRGKRPQWYLNAIASGKTPQQLQVGAAG